MATADPYAATAEKSSDPYAATAESNTPDAPKPPATWLGRARSSIASLQDKLDTKLKSVTEPQPLTGAPYYNTPKNLPTIATPAAVGTSVGNLEARAVQGLGTMAIHPLESAKGMWESVAPARANTTEAIKGVYQKAAQGQSLTDDDKQTLMLGAKAPAGPIEQRLQQFKTEYAQNPATALENAAGDVLGMYLAGKITDLAVRTGVKAVEVAPKIKNGLIESVTKTGPKETAALVKETQAGNAAEVVKAGEKNVDNAQKHLDKTQTAIHDTKGNEIEHEVKTKSANDKAQSEHASDVKETIEHNERVRDKHTKATNEIKAENERVGEVVEHRRNLERQLEEKRAEYSKREAAAAEKAKTDEKAAWNATRDKIAAGEGPKGGSGRQLLKAVKVAEDTKLKGTSPEAIRTFRAIVRQITDKLDMEEAEGVANTEAGAEGAAKAKPPHALFEKFKKSIEQLTSSSMEGGILPEGINPEDLISATGDETNDVEIPFDQIHGWVSELGHEMSTRPYGEPGDIKAALTSVYNASRRMMDDIAEENGATDELEEARATTRAQRQAFEPERVKPSSASEKAQRALNPKGMKAAQTKAQIGKAAAFDPTLHQVADDINSLQSALDHLPAEDALKGKLKPLPGPPTVGDLRGAEYQLKEIQPPPGRVDLEPPTRAEHPDRPAEVIPQTKTLGPEDVRAAKAKGLEERTQMIRRRGEWIATGAAGYRLLSHVLRGQLMAVPGDLFEGGVAIAGVSGLANLLERADMVELLTKPTDADLAQIPPDLRSELWPVVQEAARQGIRVSPKLAAMAKAAATATGASGALGAAVNNAPPKPPPVPPVVNSQP